MATTGILTRLGRDDLLLAVEDLIARRRITSNEIRAALQRRRRIERLERELATLRGDGARRGAKGAKGGKGASKPKRKIRNTPALRAARKLQGQYMGRLVKLKGKNRARIKAIAKKQSVKAAIKAADKLLRK